MSINKKRVSEFLVGKTIGNCDTFFLCMVWCFLLMKAHTLLLYNGGEALDVYLWERLY
jgi:hypothetical protein